MQIFELLKFQKYWKNIGKYVKYGEYLECLDDYGKAQQQKNIKITRKNLKQTNKNWKVYH